MKELAEKLALHIGDFIRDLISLLSGPYTFLDSRAAPGKDNLNAALAFLAICTALSFILTVTMFPDADFWTLLIQLLVHTLVGLVAYAALLRLSWHLVGGKSPLESFIIALAYLFGPVVLVSALATLLFFGILNNADPSFSRAFWEADCERLRSAIPNEEATSAGAVIVTLYPIGAAWILVSWIAFKRLNGVSNGRAVLAFVIFAVLMIPLFEGLGFIWQGMSPPVCPGL